MSLLIYEMIFYFLLYSFGNATRIDYGTGHENMFVAFLTCLNELGLILQEDHKSLALSISKICRVNEETAASVPVRLIRGHRMICRVL